MDTAMERVTKTVRTRIRLIGSPIRQESFLTNTGPRPPSWQEREKVGRTACRPGMDQLLCPAELLHRLSVVPDLRHVADLVAVEGHVVHVVGIYALACRGDGAALAGVSAVEHSVSDDFAACFVDGEGLHLGAPVRHWRQQPFHPLGVSLYVLHTCQRRSLRRERGIRMAVLLALLPSPTRLTGLEKPFCALHHRHESAPLPSFL